MSRWFRLDDDVVNDPKVQNLPDVLFRTWINVLCIASKNDGVLPPLRDVAFILRTKESAAAGLLAKLHMAGLLDKTEASFKPHNWEGRQFKSDRDSTAAERAKRYRDGKRAVTHDAKRERHASVTRDATETSRSPETETETESSLRSDGARKRGARLPADWQPSIDDSNEAIRKLGGPIPVSQELLKFHDYWKAQPGQRGVKLDWDATWRNWIRNAKPAPSGSQPIARPLSPYQQRKQETMDILDGLKAFSAGSNRSGSENPRLLLGNNR